jgi:ABC-type maltose transport system permease subunit
MFSLDANVSINTPLNTLLIICCSFAACLAKKGSFQVSFHAGNLTKSSKTLPKSTKLHAFFLLLGSLQVY